MRNRGLFKRKTGRINSSWSIHCRQIRWRWNKVLQRQKDNKNQQRFRHLWRCRWI